MRLIDSPPAPNVSFSPDGEWMLMIERDAMPGIEDISRRMLRLAGLRIDPMARMRFQTSFRKKISLKRRGDDKSTDIAIPDRISTISWCHDSKSLAAVTVSEKGTELHVVQLDDPSSVTTLSNQLSMVLEGFHWAPDGKSIVTLVVPDGQSEEPQPGVAPKGPNIQETSGNTSPTRTYQDLLQGEYDERLFEHYATAQMVRLGLNGEVTKIGKPAMIYSVDSSPIGEYLLVSTIRRPFSYLQTVRSFPRDIQVWDKQGNVVYTVANVPLAENIPIQGVRIGPRMVDWQSSKPASLLWAEALDGGDPEVEVDHRDRWMELAAPFDAEPSEVLRVEHRAYGVGFLEDANQWITTEYDRDRRWVRSLLHQTNDKSATPRVLTDRSIRDRYGDPGTIYTVPNEHGHSVALEKDGWVYRVGNGASPEGMLPFLDRQNLDSMETERIWRCEPEQYERVVDIVGGTAADTEFVTQHQSLNEVPNYFLRKGTHSAGSALTEFPNLTPEVQQIKKQLIKYERTDGVPLSGTLYLPPNYKEGTRL
ncbi:MAG: S9 family peptidase, partial [Planctomycetota bacterium]